MHLSTLIILWYIVTTTEMDNYLVSMQSPGDYEVGHLHHIFFPNKRMKIEKSHGCL